MDFCSWYQLHLCGSVQHSDHHTTITFTIVDFICVAHFSIQIITHHHHHCRLHLRDSVLYSDHHTTRYIFLLVPVHFCDFELIAAVAFCSWLWKEEFNNLLILHCHVLNFLDLLFLCLTEVSVVCHWWNCSAEVLHRQKPWTTCRHWGLSRAEHSLNYCHGMIWIMPHYKTFSYHWFSQHTMCLQLCWFSPVIRCLCCHCFSSVACHLDHRWSCLCVFLQLVTPLSLLHHHLSQNVFCSQLELCQSGSWLHPASYLHHLL